MKNYHKNPRQIKGKQFKDLQTWLLELGDLSGIVHDLNTDEVVSGNQRMRAIDIAKCKVELTDGPHDPDKQGTVAHGYVIWKDAKYNYRQVRWTPKQCEKANIVANKAGGEWDFEALANGFDFDELVEWGFKEWELGMIANNDPEKEWEGMPEFDQDDVSGAILTIKVHFETIDDIAKFSGLINQNVTQKTKFIWFPKKEKLNLKNEFNIYES